MRSSRIALALLALAAVHAATKDHNEIFNKWFQDISRGNKVYLEDAPEMERGVYAIQDVKEGDEVFRVPLEYVICEKTILQSKNGKYYKALKGKLTEMMAAFILEQSQDPNSKFAPWFPVLPRSFDSPVFFSNSEKKELQGEPEILNDASRKEQSVREGFQTVQSLLWSKHPGKFFPKKYKPKKEDFAWAVCLIDSRAWNLDGGKFLAPMADFFNHAPIPDEDYSVEPAMRGEHFQKHHKVRNDELIVISDRDAKAKHQVWETYGDNTNSIYFLYHGFVPEVNAYDCATVNLPPIDRNDPSSQQRFMLIQRSGLQLRSFRHCVRNDHRQFALVRDYIKVAKMSSAEVDACAQKGVISKCATSLSHSALYDKFAESIRQQLKEYPTSTEKDERMLAKGKTTGRKLLSLRFRLSHKRILSSLVNWLYKSDASSSEKKGGKKGGRKKREL